MRALPILLVLASLLSLPLAAAVEADAPVASDVDCGSVFVEGAVHVATCFALYGVGMGEIVLCIAWRLAWGASEPCPT